MMWLTINSYSRRHCGVKKYIFKIDNELVEKTLVYGVDKTNVNFVWGGCCERYTWDWEYQSSQIVKKIMKSKKTIIRCEGTDNYYDMTVTEKEKKALQNVLDAYEVISGKPGEFYK